MPFGLPARPQFGQQSPFLVDDLPLPQDNPFGMRGLFGPERTPPQVTLLPPIPEQNLTPATPQVLANPFLRLMIEGLRGIVGPDPEAAKRRFREQQRLREQNRISGAPTVQQPGVEFISAPASDLVRSLTGT